MRTFLAFLCFLAAGLIFFGGIVGAAMFLTHGERREAAEICSRRNAEADYARGLGYVCIERDTGQVFKPLRDKSSTK